MADYNTHNGSSAREVFLRTIAIIGLIAVLVLGAWGIILLAFNLPAVFGTIGSSIRGAFGGPTTPSAELSVSAPQSAASGTTIQVSWEHAGGADTMYTLSFVCESGLTVKAPRANGSYEEVSCNTPFNFVNARENIRLIPTVTGTATKSFVVTVNALNADGNPIAFSSATVNVTPGTSGTPTTPSTPSNGSSTNGGSTYVPAASRPAQLYGYADLVVHISSITPLTQHYGYGHNNQTRRYTMQFTIENVGTNVTQHGWNFNTLIPWQPQTYTFTSERQQALYPGDKIVYTLGFDAWTGGTYHNPDNQNITCGYRYNGYTNVYSCGYYDTNGNWVDVGTNYNTPNYHYPYPSNRTVTVNVDPNNWVPEANETNNRATATLPY